MLRAAENRWEEYRRALRRQDQPHFDRLFEHARTYADASGYFNHQYVEIPILVSIALAQEKRIAALEEKLDAGEDTE